MPAPSFLSGLPKPLLFGLYGAIGGLLGALALGEPAWRMLKPPPPPPPPPQLGISTSPRVQVYPKSMNTFAVQVARERFAKPVTVKFEAVKPEKFPDGMTIATLTVAADKTEAQATVTTTEAVKPGDYEVKATAEAEGVDPASSELFTVTVVPTPKPPPAVAIAIPNNLTLYTSGTSTFTASIDRREYTKAISVSIEPLPAGVTFTSKEISPTEIEVTLKAAPEAMPTGAAATELTVTASAADPALKDSMKTKLSIQKPPIAPVDIVFVLDVTASMQWAIDDLKNGIGKFADALSKAQLDFRIGLVTFQDITIPGEKIEVVQFKNGDMEEPFTTNATTFRDKVSVLKAEGGGDIPETSIEAVVEATKMPFRQKATRLLLLITDAPPKITRTSVKDAVTLAKDKGIDAIHLVVMKQDRDVYKPLLTAGADKTGGITFDLGDIVRGDEGFNTLFDRFSHAVADAARAKSPEGKAQVAPAPPPANVAAADAATPKAAEAAAPPAIQSVQSSGQFAAGTEGKLTLAIGVWTGALSSLMCLTLLAGQTHYLRGSLPAFGGILAGLLGGLVVGTAGGAAGQGLFMLSSATAFRVLGWALLGGLAGAGLSFFIPNMKWFLGLAGGAIGGAIGAVGYIAVTGVAGDLVGRLVGGLLLGFCIGLMVAVVEAAFRRAWLEVRYGREVITVNLGPEPVKVGGDAKACTVWARGAAPIALRFFLRDGKVICDDPVMKREVPVGDGFSKDVGNVTVTVHTGSGAAAAPPAPPPPAPPRKPATVDDDFELPMPIPMNPAPQRVASPPAPPKPPPAPVGRNDNPLPAPVAPPVPPKPAPPPPKPVAPPAPVAAKPPAPTAPPPRPPTPVASKPVMPPVPPRPIAPPPKPPAPVAAKPATPAVPPAATKPPASPPPSAGAKHPDACPSCGRVNAGKPKQRYCMVCDNTY